MTEAHSNIKNTPLTELHLDKGAKMVSFAGYNMPIQYPEGIIQEHLHTRHHAGLFDVSHMLQLSLSGNGLDEALEKILPIAVKELKADRQRYGFFTLENGGILDDLMLTRVDAEHFYMVVNASRQDVDLAHLKSHLSGFKIETIDNALVALQGPEAAAVIDKQFPEFTGAASMKFMDSRLFERAGQTYRLSRSGYTGEDGYEISIPPAQAIAFCETLLADSRVKPIGLGARDTLRLEAGLCLYGNDIDENTSPVEADLLWAMQKVRKLGGDRAGGFLGATPILAQIEHGAERKRIGFIGDDKTPIRAGSKLFDVDGREVGVVNSGTFSPCLEKPIGMAYVKSDCAQLDGVLYAEVRNRKLPVRIQATPFVAQRYYRG